MIIGVRDVEVWDARREDIRRVCLSVIECFAPAVAERPIEPIQIVPGADCPRARFERDERGYIVIELTARGQYWARFAYEFAHEFGHVLANFKIDSMHQTRWLEESLCDTASLFALRRMAERWLVAPPYRNWASYADALAGYARAIKSPESARQVSLAGWLRTVLPDLEHKPINHASLAPIVEHFLRLFESDPDAWRAVRYFESWNEPVPFGPEYFAAWRAAAPDRLHAAIARIEKCLLVDESDPPAISAEGEDA